MKPVEPAVVKVILKFQRLYSLFLAAAVADLGDQFGAQPSFRVLIVGAYPLNGRIVAEILPVGHAVLVEQGYVEVLTCKFLPDHVLGERVHGIDVKPGSVGVAEGIRELLLQSHALVFPCDEAVGERTASGI